MGRMLPHAVAMTVAALICPSAHGQAYPVRSIRIVVPFPPGGGTDILARAFGQKFTEAWGQPVVVDNRAGANGNIAAEFVARSPGDGYTLFVCTVGTHAINPAIYSKMPYDPVRDLSPIARLAYGSFALVVPANSPFKSARELLAAAGQSGKMNYGSGSATYQIATEWLLSLASAKANMIAYKGAAPMLTDLAGGQIDFALAEYSGVLPLSASGRLRMLAVTSDKRQVSAPDTPTLQELGYKDYAPVAWWAMFAPARLPAAIAEKLERTLLEIYSSEDARQYLAKNHFVAFPADAAGLRKYQMAEIEREQRIIEGAKIPRQ